MPIKKAKYELTINNSIQYSFVTISKDEEECVEILKGKAENKVYKQITSYSIKKIQDGVDYLLYKGTIKASY